MSSLTAGFVFIVVHRTMERSSKQDTFQCQYNILRALDTFLIYKWQKSSWFICYIEIEIVRHKISCPTMNQFKNALQNLPWFSALPSFHYTTFRVWLIDKQMSHMSIEKKTGDICHMSCDILILMHFRLDLPVLYYVCMGFYLRQ